jgi:hypothetical protein
MRPVTFSVILGIILILHTAVGFSQFATSTEKMAFRSMEKHRWQKAEARLRKALAKNTLNPSVRYVLSVFYFHPENPAFNLDSAHHYVADALADLMLTSGHDRERLARVSIDSLHLLRLRSEIDITAFEVARKSNTEEAYSYFITHFPAAAQRQLAEDLRAEVAYEVALRGNTYEAFHDFIERYPYAKRVPEARAHYERLLYLEKTQDKRLSSYERFLSEHPETPYRPEIVRYIFQLATADGDVKSFVDFMTRYPGTHEAKIARQLAFHLLLDDEEAKWPPGVLNDSLENLRLLNSFYLVPVLRNDRYGFMDEYGHEVVGPRFKTIDPDYLCGYVTSDVLSADGHLVSRKGGDIYTGPVDDVESLGAGFLKIVTPSGVKVIHKSGFIVADSLEDARVLSRAYLALKKFDAWFLYTLTGRLLDANPWDDIAALGDVVTFRSGKKIFLARKNQLAAIANGHPLEFSAAFDEVRAWTHDLVWAKAGENEGVFDQNLKAVIPMEKRKLTQTFFGALARESGGPALYNWLGQRSNGFQSVHTFDQWVVVQQGGKWRLFDPRFGQIESKPYDTIRAEGPFVVGVLTDTLYVHYRDNRVRMFVHPAAVSFIPGMDTTSFLLLKGDKQNTVYDLAGHKLFSGEFDALTYGGDGVFIVTKKEKKGLVNAAGQTLLPAEYDAIGTSQNGLISLLKNKRFGSYNVRDKKLIKPQYDRNLYPYGADWITTFRDGYYGFLGWDNKAVSKFEFDEISYWNDSIALVRKGTFWNLYDIAHANATSGNMRNVKLIKDTQAEKLAIVQKDNNFGVISSRRGVVVPISFSDVINLGSAEEPLYFTEKQVREASLFVVIYYDRDGNLLRKEIYEDPAEYDRIYCSDH